MTLRVHTSELTIKLPIANAELVGVRDVIDDEGLQAVYAVLREPFVEEAANWSRRYKANQEKMASGSVFRVSEVVRDLWRRDQDQGVSAGEKRMLVKARQILESELASGPELHARRGHCVARRGAREFDRRNGIRRQVIHVLADRACRDLRGGLDRLDQRPIHR